MWQSRTKSDLIIEVWEKLDCESVGREEIEAIEVVVREKYGENAVESPMIIARQLADEGAELRHSEIMKLDVERRLDTPYAPMFRNILRLSSFKQTLSSIRQMENLRQKFLADDDAKGMRLLRETAQRGKQKAQEIAHNESLDLRKRELNFEIVEWLNVWLGSPDVFEDWIKLRKGSEDYKQKFPEEDL